MPLLWDASGLAKRYFPEQGSSTVDALFAAVPPHERVTTLTAYAETFAALCRKRNRAEIGEESFRVAVSSLQFEVLDDEDFRFWPIDDATILASFALIERHSLNASDAAILSAFLRESSASGDEDAFVVVTADRRFARAVAAEGFTVLDPETLAPEEVPSLLARLQTR